MASTGSGSMPAHHHGAVAHLRNLLGAQHLVHLPVAQMIGHDGRGAREPEVRHTGQDAALVGNRRRQHDVKRRQAVGRHDEQILVIHLINVAHLALTKALQGA